MMLDRHSDVSIHAPTWGATPSVFVMRVISQFQSTRPRGARLPCEGAHKVEVMFQSTRPRGARPLLPGNIPLGVHVSIHAPTWGATPSRLRKSRPQDVSIHAPTWGATIASGNVLEHVTVSIHAPTWGATNVLTRSVMSFVFQSTRPRGARHKIYWPVLVASGVSIHAPTWGAT